MAELSRLRSQIELFFRWIKQNLRSRTSYNTSPNAVNVQIWTAINTHLAVALARRNDNITTNLTTFQEVPSLHPCARVPVD